MPVLNLFILFVYKYIYIFSIDNFVVFSISNLFADISRHQFWLAQQINT